uniref:Uncharacterized protein n=1 Tax=Oryza sativa subsp. japonica TaxID=39947 RepID=Q6Z431_ORYSJ|nr:hypothetical protein [Oryza sativa Japonica Group]
MEPQNHIKDVLAAEIPAEGHRLLLVVSSLCRTCLPQRYRPEVATSFSWWIRRIAGGCGW